MTTYSTNSTSCSDFPEWKECGCAIEQGAGYDNTDGVHTYCVGTVKYLAESLTDDKNCDDPLEGSRKIPATWSVQTYADFVGGKQDPLQDCNGAVLPEDTQVVTCTDMTQREAVLNTAIDSRQAPLLSCAGNALPANTRVPTCDEMNNAIANVDTAEPYALRDCGGAALLNNALVASCDDFQAYANANTTILNAKQNGLVDCTGTSLAAGTMVPTCEALASTNDATIINRDRIEALETDKQDKLTNCAGGALTADTAVVACDEFGDKFDEEFAKADKCLTLVDIGNNCGTFETITAVACENGGYQLGIVPGGSRCYGTTFNDLFTDVFPADPDTALGNELYENSVLFSDFRDDTVDYTLLNNSKVSEGSHTVPCDGLYRINLNNEVFFTHDYLGVAIWVLTVDGVLASPDSDLDSVAFSTPFPNSTSRMEDSMSIYLTAGTHTIARHLVGVSNNRYQPAQVYRSIGLTQVCRAN